MYRAFCGECYYEDVTDKYVNTFKKCPRCSAYDGLRYKNLNDDYYVAYC